jgi:hypothetical protein
MRARLILLALLVITWSAAGTYSADAAKLIGFSKDQKKCVLKGKCKGGQ